MSQHQIVNALQFAVEASMRSHVLQMMSNCGQLIQRNSHEGDCGKIKPP